MTLLKGVSEHVPVHGIQMYVHHVDIGYVEEH
jgi:hypothetical protein